VADQNGNLQSVIDRMVEIQHNLGGERAADGVARFNRLYLGVTQAVDAAIRADKFTEPEFVEQLARNFAGFYFDAYDASTNGGVPEAWRLLFERRYDPGIAPFQFALAGMNAHINHDLALALVETWKPMNDKPDHDSPEHVDYEYVNTILKQVEENIKGLLETETLARADALLGKADDAFAIWSVARARDTAWTAAEVLWALRDVPDADRRMGAVLAGLVSLGGHGLLR
jgi:hypothetical protein